MQNGARQYMKEVLSNFNLIVKQALKQKKYEQIGKFPKFFNASEKIEIPQFKLVAWPGYDVQTKLATQGIFFNVESCTKFINMVSINTLFKEHVNNGYYEKEFFEDYNSSNVDKGRKVVITEHNSKSYQVDGMTNDFSPDTYRFDLKDGRSCSMTEYFYERYKIKLSPKQPLLYVNYNSGDKVYLPAELCHDASLPKNFTSDAYKMRELQ